MTKLENLHEAIGIIIKYLKKNGAHEMEYSFASGHDELFLPRVPHPDSTNPLELNDVQKIRSLGLIWDRTYDCWQIFI